MSHHVHVNAPSEASSKNSAHKPTTTRSKRGSISLHTHDAQHAGHRRESISHLLYLPSEFSRRRAYSWQGHPIPTKITYEPTYQLEPAQKPNVKGIGEVIDRELNDLLHDVKYNSFEAANLSKVISDRLQSETKKLLAERSRYKVVCLVSIAQLMSQSLQISSRCLWDKEFDVEVTRAFRNRSLIAVASVFCVYTS